MEKQVRTAVEQVVDPETGMTFGQMQMITNVNQVEPGVFKIDFVPSSPFCPIAFKLAADIKAAAMSVKGVKKALVYCRGHTMEEEINKTVNK
ncbi:MAG TPA: iron-sulfur cluster assembly protein [Candidatus Krumholzibacteriaceae bacterium]|jgi:metal-sulfur cluster biosynthetic enzyme|nr:iron-sulfur cluster assembly protein [Candidatus Krumholzibacteriaceae bacterium]